MASFDFVSIFGALAKSQRKTVCCNCNTKSTLDLPQLHCITNAILHGLHIGIPSLVHYIPVYYPHSHLLSHLSLFSIYRISIQAYPSTLTALTSLPYCTLHPCLTALASLPYYTCIPALLCLHPYFTVLVSLHPPYHIDMCYFMYDIVVKY